MKIKLTVVLVIYLVLSAIGWLLCGLIGMYGRITKTARTSQ